MKKLLWKAVRWLITHPEVIGAIRDAVKDEKR
jgi:hypothetical protein